MHKNFLRPYASRVAFLQRFMDIAIIFVVYEIVIIIAQGAWDYKQVLTVVLSASLFAIFASSRGLYNSWRISSFFDEMRTLLLVWLFVIAALLIIAFANKISEDFSRLMTVTWALITPSVMILIRIIVRSLMRYARRNGANVRSVAVVGHNQIGARLIKQLNAMPWTGLVIKGVFDYPVSTMDSGIIAPWYDALGSIDNLLEQVHAGEIDAVYIALPIKAERKIEGLVNSLSDSTVSVYVVPDFFVSELMHSRWIDFGGMPLVSVYETPFYGIFGWVKRAEDLILASFILLLITPIMLGIALAIKLTSPGSVLFKQRRYGLNGLVVEVWKFRSMTASDDGDNVQQATKGDMRITPLGALLRRTSLDELPQFFNVLQGSMSVVGPRPHAIAHNEQYRKLIKGYMLRHKVKPGITGWAQVNGWRGETDTLDKMQSRITCDLEYIQNWSLSLDLKIVFLTIFKGFVGKNVY